MPKTKSIKRNTTVSRNKKPTGLLGRLRAMSSKKRMLILVMLFAVLGSILVVSSEAASLTASQKSQLKSLKGRHDRAENSKKASCKKIDNKSREKTCKSQLKSLQNSNDRAYDNLKNSFKSKNKRAKNSSGVCGASTYAVHINGRGHDGASGSGSSSGSSGSSGQGSSGGSGSGGNSSSTRGSSGNSSSSNNSCR